MLSQFQVLAQRFDAFVPLKQKETLFGAVPPSKGPDGVDATARDRSLEVHEAIRLLCYALLQDVSDVVSSNAPYTLRDDWVELDKFRIKQECLPLAVATLPDFLASTLNIS